MMPLPRAVFFCGHHSRYGLAHLHPIMDTFPVTGIVIADDVRWRIFRQALSGEDASIARETRRFSWIKSLKMQASRSLDRTPKERLIRTAKQRGIPVHVIHDANSEQAIGLIRELSPKLIISAAYPQIFGSELLAFPSGGCVNFHPSLLPQFRGAHPHFWAIAKGSQIGGVSVHFMTTKIDDGNLIAQIPIEIGDITYTQYYNLIERATPALVEKLAAFLHAGGGRGLPQAQQAASFYRNDRRIHHRIFWSSMPAKQIYDLIRTERAFCEFRGRPLHICAGRLLEDDWKLTNQATAEAGTIVAIDGDGLVVATIDGFISVSRLSDSGKSQSPINWYRKHKVFIGQKLN